MKEKVAKILFSLPYKFKRKMTTIEEDSDIIKLIVEDVIGDL